MILNPAYKGAANAYLDGVDTDSAVGTDSDLYDQLDPDWIAQNVCYQDPPNVPARAFEPTVHEEEEEPHGDKGSKQTKVKISVATLVPAAVLTLVLALLAIIIVAVFNTSTSNYNQEVETLQIEIETLREMIIQRKYYKIYCAILAWHLVYS